MKENFFLFILLTLSEASSIFNRIFPKTADAIEISALESRINELKKREIKAQNRIEAKREEILNNLVECKYNQVGYKRSVSEEEYLKFQKEFEGGVIGYNIQCQDPTPEFFALQEANKIGSDSISLVGTLRKKVLGVTVEERMQEIFEQNEKIKKREQEIAFLSRENERLENTSEAYSNQLNFNSN